jgi:hypothetical protein
MAEPIPSLGTQDRLVLQDHMITAAGVYTISGSSAIAGNYNIP